MSLLKSISGIASNVIKQFGTTLMVERDAQDGYDPATGMVTSGKRRFMTKGVVERISKDGQGGSVQMGDFKFITPSTGELKTGDTVQFGSTRCVIYLSKGVPLQDGNAAFEAFGRI